MFHPSQKEFEKFVPSLRDGGEEIYKGVYPYLQPSYWRLKNELKVELMNNKAAPYFRRAVYATAAYRALPTLDLVATPNGFGVVSNNNIAPASKERVAALRESLRQYKSDCKDQCLERIYLTILDVENGNVDNSKKRNEYGASITDVENYFSGDEQLRKCLIYSATVAREAGITMKDGSPVYEEELQKLEYQIAVAETRIKRLISWKQFDYEMGCRRYNSEMDMKLRKLAAMYVMDAPRNAVKDYENEILDIMEENAERYKYYHASVQRELRKKPVRYENRKEDATYFF